MFAKRGFSKRNFVTADSILSTSKCITIIYLYEGIINKMTFLMVIW